MKAEELHAGDVSKTDKGTLRITKVHVDPRSEEVYNFEVAENHTYLVTDQGVVVHNAPHEQYSNRVAKTGYVCATPINQNSCLSPDAYPALPENMSVNELYAPYYQLPNGARLPLNGPITSTFGVRVDPTDPSKGMQGHGAVDIGTRPISPKGDGEVFVPSVAPGTVTKAEYWGGYGNVVIVDHGFGVQTLYAHNSRLHVQVGEEVLSNRVVATTGSTGKSTGPHTHFEVRVHGQKVDPRTFDWDGYFTQKIMKKTGLWNE